MDLLSSFKVEMIDLKALHATHPASANVTPGRMASACRTRPIHSTKPSIKDGWMTQNQTGKLERSSSNVHEQPHSRHASPKKSN